MEPPLKRGTLRCLGSSGLVRGVGAAGGSCGGASVSGWALCAGSSSGLGASTDVAASISSVQSLSWTGECRGVQPQAPSDLSLHDPAPLVDPPCCPLAHRNEGCQPCRAVVGKSSEGAPVALVAPLAPVCGGTLRRFYGIRVETLQSWRRSARHVSALGAVPGPPGRADPQRVVRNRNGKGAALPAKRREPTRPRDVRR
jgi:hypothetical protein